jgi:hypothetical protein
MIRATTGVEPEGSRAVTKTLNPTELRQNIYRVLDEALATGEPCEIRRGDERLLLLPLQPRRRSLEDLPRRKAVSCSADELVAMSWDGAWEPGL